MTPPERKKSIQRWALWLAVAIPVAAVIIYLLIWYGPDVIARHDIGNVTGPPRVLRLQQARDAARGRLLTLGAGLFAAGALVFTARNLTLYRHTNELTEQGQVTDRYTKAIEQLGSDKLDVRIGGIYALERVARDSARDHPTAIEVLSAFIREHSREQWPLADDESEVGAPERKTRPDVQAAVTVIGRLNPRHDRQPVNLKAADLIRADLKRADLTDVKLTGANLSYADLMQADLTHADLTHADLSFADLTDARLSYAHLTGATLAGANLTRAQFNRADLKRADLSDATVNGAYFGYADFTGANLTGAYLDHAGVSHADFSDVLLAPRAAVPVGWQRDTHSGRMKRVGTNARDATTN